MEAARSSRVVRGVQSTTAEDRWKVCEATSRSSSTKLSSSAASVLTMQCSRLMRQRSAARSKSSSSWIRRRRSSSAIESLDYWRLVVHGITLGVYIVPNLLNNVSNVESGG